MTDNRTPDMALLPGERAMSAVEWAEYGGLPPTLKAYCHRLIREEAEIRRRQRIDELEAAEWRARSMRAVDRLGAAEQRAEAAEQRAENAEQRAEALAAEVAQLQSYRAEAEAAAHFAQGVAYLLASPGAETDAVRLLRAADLPDLLNHLRERLAQPDAPGGDQ